MQDGDLEHETEVGDEVCIICEQRIADLPEPPTYQYDVALHVTLVVSLKASSPVEAQAVAFDALNIQGEGVTSWKCTAQENFIIDEEEP